jgi:PAS domain S-box-containing protein
VPGANAVVASILDCVAQPVLVADQDGLIQFANPSAVAALGYDDGSELLGKPGHQTIHHKHPDGTSFPAGECPLLLPRITGETIHRADDWFVRRDGAVFPVEYWSAPIDGLAGRGAVIAFQDVGQRRRTEEVLRERDAILSALGQPVYVATPEGLITYANPAATTVLGFSDASELLGQNAHWLVHYKRRDGSRFPIDECPLARCRETGNLVRIEEDWLVRKDGSMVPVACTAVPYETRGGYGIAVSFTDLTARRASEQATREREVAEARAAELSAGETRHRAILAAALDGVIIIDQQGIVTYVNAAAERIFGYRADQVLGRELAEAFVPPSSRKAHRRGLARYLATGKTHILDRRIETTAMHADGSEFPAELTVTRADLPGEPAFIGYIRDITERQRTEQDLEESRAELTASRARIVTTGDEVRRRIERDLHDGAQQRLVSIALQLRAAQAAAPPEADELTQRLEGVVTEVTSVLEELRETAHGLHPAILTQSGLRPALKALARRSAVPLGLDVQVAGQLPEPVEIAAYYAVSEALTNAAKHAHASAAEVEVAADDGMLRVCVRDDGRGGAEFGKGSGLVGLKDRIEALGGRIWLQSPPGAGTAVQIALPLEGPGGAGRPGGAADR